MFGMSHYVDKIVYFYVGHEMSSLLKTKIEFYYDAITFSCEIKYIYTNVAFSEGSSERRLTLHSTTYSLILYVFLASKLLNLYYIRVRNWNLWSTSNKFVL